MAMSLLVRLRPNGPYLLFMMAAMAGIWYGVVLADPAHGVVDVGCGIVIAVAAGVVLAVFGYPVVASTVCRVPVVAVGSDGIRLPLMGPRLSWPEVASAKLSFRPGRRAPIPILLIFPADPQAAIAAAHPWLRRETRGHLARYGTPIMLSDLSLDHSVEDIAAAIRQYLPATPA